MTRSHYSKLLNAPQCNVSCCQSIGKRLREMTASNTVFGSSHSAASAVSTQQKPESAPHKSNDATVASAEIEFPFPFEPYAVQKQLMNSIFELLRTAPAAPTSHLDLLSLSEVNHAMNNNQSTTSLTPESHQHRAAIGLFESPTGLFCSRYRQSSDYQHLHRAWQYLSTDTCTICLLTLALLIFWIGFARLCLDIAI